MRLDIGFDRIFKKVGEFSILEQIISLIGTGLSTTQLYHTRSVNISGTWGKFLLEDISSQDMRLQIVLGPDVGDVPRRRQYERQGTPGSFKVYVSMLSTSST